MDDGCTGVLAERKDSFHGSLGVTQELQSHVFVILGSLRIGEDSRNLLVMSPAEHELAIVETLLRHQRERLGRNLKDSLVA